MVQICKDLVADDVESRASNVSRRWSMPRFRLEVVLVLSACFLGVTVLRLSSVARTEWSNPTETIASYAYLHQSVCDT